ncbi:hypothetical protein ACFQ08_19570 [Streptosporangium algeriense]|uniref:GNAT family N-acetyltransferase n=1 Tax=Streptosporangium algeriense TaxID=1682748 RepID=A0ABW3DUR0_9ACTN
MRRREGHLSPSHDRPPRCRRGPGSRPRTAPGLAILGRPFSHVEAFNPGDGLGGPPDEAGFGSVEEFDAATDGYRQRYEATAGDPRHSVGPLYLCHPGCAHLEALMVTGPARGQMWADGTTGDEGFEPLLDDDGEPVGFVRWHLRRLEEAEAQVLSGTR